MIRLISLIAHTSFHLGFNSDFITCVFLDWPAMRKENTLIAATTGGDTKIAKSKAIFRFTYPGM